MQAALAAKWKEPPRDALDTMVLKTGLRLPQARAHTRAHTLTHNRRPQAVAAHAHASRHAHTHARMHAHADSADTHTCPRLPPLPQAGAQAHANT